MEKELVQMMGVFLLLIAAFVGLALAGNAYACGAKWERSGFATDWGPIQGCLIKVAAGKWIPEERYRELDE